MEAQSSRLTAPDIVLGAPTCRSCRIGLVKWGELGGDGKEEDGANFSALGVTASGDVLGSVFGARELVRLDRHGTVLHRIGRQGDGPGEYRMPWRLLVSAKDTTYVEDFVTARVSVLDERDKFIRSYRVPPGTRQFVPLGGTNAVVSALLYGAKGVDARITALPLHLVRNDSIVRSFGVPIRSFDARAPVSPADRILLPYNGSVIAIPYSYRHLIEVWDTNGTLSMRLVRDPTWFKPFERPGRSFADPPDPKVTGAWLDSAQLLWVVLTHAAPHWHDAISSAMSRGEGGRETYSVDRPNLLLMSTIEVIDLRRHELLATADVPFEIRYALGSGIVGQMVWDGPQGGNVILHKVTLTGNH
jgi:hypothetical protein